MTVKRTACEVGGAAGVAAGNASGRGVRVGTEVDHRAQGRHAAGRQLGPQPSILTLIICLVCAEYDDDASSPAVTILSQQDPTVRVRLLDRRFLDEYNTAFTIEAEADGLQARIREVTVWPWDRERSLAGYLSGLAANFRGWTGERLWQVHGLAVRATFHSGGHVDLTWMLRARDRFQDWDASVTTWIEAGEQMSALAREVGDFLSRD